MDISAINLCLTEINHQQAPPELIIGWALTSGSGGLQINSCIPLMSFAGSTAREVQRPNAASIKLLRHARIDETKILGKYCSLLAALHTISLFPMIWDRQHSVSHSHYFQRGSKNSGVLFLPFPLLLASC